MPVPDDDVERVAAWAAARFPAEAADQIRLELDRAPRHLTIMECRPPWNDRMGSEWTRHAVARLSWSETSGVWTLHEVTADGRFHRTRWCAPTSDVGSLLAAIDEDPTGIFWG